VDNNKSNKVSSEMVKTGVRILRESGRLYGESSADPLLVREILETALDARKVTRTRCKPASSTRETPSELRRDREGRSRL